MTDGGLAVLPCSASKGRAGRGSQNIELACVRTPLLGRPSKRTATVAGHFGLPHDAAPETIFSALRLPLSPGTIVALLGPSGCGKSSALSALMVRFAGSVMVDAVCFPKEAALIDAVDAEGGFADAAATLTRCGLGDAKLWLRRYEELSEGERFRARLARAVSLHVSRRSCAPLICDEFCSNLHRRAAKAISFKLRKLVSSTAICLVVAASQDDLLGDLQPDVIVRMAGPNRFDVEHRKCMQKRSVSFRRRLRIQRGEKKDYDDFAAMHYRATDELGFVDRVFVLRDGLDGDMLGIVVYAHGPIELRLRNVATKSRFVRDHKRLNREMRILRRLVIHPDVRGSGLGHFFVHKTLPMVGTPYVECLATMGEFNPVFEKAGMKRIGQYEASQVCRKGVVELRSMGVDPMSVEFTRTVCRSRKARRIVARVVADWYERTTAGKEDRVKRQRPEFLAQTFRCLMGSRPVYYLWQQASRERTAGRTS